MDAAARGRRAPTPGDCHGDAGLGRARGRAARSIDDFLVTLIQDDGTRRTVVRNGAEPKIELRDPSEAHRKLVPTLADKDMHNVTAYLWTIK